MSLPKLMRKSAEKALEEFCRHWLPPRPEDAEHLICRLEGEEFTLLAVTRAAGAGILERPLAQLRFHHELGQWSLHYPDEEGHWKLCLNTPPTLHIGKLLAYLEADPLGFFRG